MSPGATPSQQPKSFSWFGMILTVLIFEVWGAFVFGLTDGLGPSYEACAKVYPMGWKLIGVVLSNAIEIARANFIPYLVHPILILGWALAVVTGIKWGKPRCIIVCASCAVVSVAISYFMLDVETLMYGNVYLYFLSSALQLIFVMLACAMSRLLW